eukprot:3671319-Pyramimonas_sp.AAC.1
MFVVGVCLSVRSLPLLGAASGTTVVPRGAPSGRRRIPSAAESERLKIDRWVCESGSAVCVFGRRG